VHKEFVPPGQTVNWKIYCDVLRRLGENIRCKRPDKWRNNSWALHRDNAPALASLVVQQFLAYTNTTVIPPPSLLASWDFFPIPKDEIETQGATFWRHWRDPERIAERDVDADAKWLPEVLPIMEIPLVSLYHFKRELLRKRWGE
jgi:hypothetical protein